MNSIYLLTKVWCIYEKIYYLSHLNLDNKRKILKLTALNGIKLLADIINNNLYK